MNYLYKLFVYLLISLSMGINVLWADNQTPGVDTPSPETNLPFTVNIETANFQLPKGVHSGVFGTYNGLWVLIGGSTRGLHGFGADPFPANGQNNVIYVVNPVTGVTVSRTLPDNSTLTDTLSVISPQAYQESNTLYMSGGYGVDNSNGTFGTKPVFTAINLPGIVQWVLNPGNTNNTLTSNIRQIYNPIFQIAGGEMFQLGNATRIVFGQNFTGVYTPGSNGEYNEQVRQFQIYDNGGDLAVQTLDPTPLNPDPNYRRRDLNVMPVILNNDGLLKYGLVAYAGVFTPTTGVWTVPVIINDQGIPSMADPTSPNTFKQGMNHYVCASTGLYSRKYMSMYNIFFGGISYGFFDNTGFDHSNEIPFINQVTTVQIDKNNKFTQYIMNNQYPVIPSTGSNPGNTLLFGAGAYFIPANIRQYPNHVISLDSIRQPTVIGYIVGGIQSTLDNTSVDSDSSASPHIFKVTLIPK